MPRSLYQRIEQPQDDGVSKLLGPVETAIMELLWARVSATVRDITAVLQTERQVAYTTVMTIMNNLAEKGLLRRIRLDKRTFLYEAALTREAFMQGASERVVQALIRDFGELALTEFALALEEATPAERTRIKRLLKERVARSRPAEDPADAR